MSDDKGSTSSNNMGLAKAIGAGLGIIFGKSVFDNVGIGLVIEFEDRLAEYI